MQWNMDGYRFLSVCAVIVATSASAQSTVTLADKLVPTVPTDVTEFGGALAVSGDLAVVRAMDDQDDGHVYFFLHLTGTTWFQTDKVLAPSDEFVHHEEFGQSVAIDSATAVIGDPEAYDPDAGVGSGVGAAYIYTREFVLLPVPGWIWTETTRLTPSAPSAGGQFGTAVSIDGDHVLVGDQKDHVFAFERDQGGEDAWGEIQVLTPSDDDAMHQAFGMAIAMHDDTAVVGSYLADPDLTNNGGAVYVFGFSDGSRFPGWSEEDKLLLPVPKAQDVLGWSVDVTLDTSTLLPFPLLVAAAGAPALGDPADGGKVAIWQRPSHGGAWALDAVVTSPNASSGRFGYSVAADADRVVVGDMAAHAFGGEAWVFGRDATGWPAEFGLRGAGTDASDHFGRAVAADGPSVLIGAPGFDSAAGTVFLSRVLFANGFEAGDTNAWSETVPSD